MTNITVAIAAATMVKRAVRKVIIAKGKARKKMKVRRRCAGWARLTAASGERVWGGRDETASGDRKMRMKVRTAAVRKRPNIQ